MFGRFSLLIALFLVPSGVLGTRDATGTMPSAPIRSWVGRRACSAAQPVVELQSGPGLRDDCASAGDYGLGRGLFAVLPSGGARLETLWLAHGLTVHSSALSASFRRPFDISPRGPPVA